MVENNKTRMLCLISGGIDSPVAAWRLARQGYETGFLFFDNRPFVSDKEIDIVKNCIKKMKENLNRKSVKSLNLFVVSHGKTLAEIAKSCIEDRRRLQCVLCRRMMFRIANKIAKNNGYDMLCTGENLAQVASQTLENMITEHNASDLPVLQPLLGFDKAETTVLSKELGFFEFSQHHKCCSMVPARPRTTAKEKEAEEAEKKIDVEKLINEAIGKTEKIEI